MPCQLLTWMLYICQGLFNFKPSVRPVPLECHIQGFPGKFYCPRMATMNKPAYAAIQVHSLLLLHLDLSTLAAQSRGVVLS